MRIITPERLDEIADQLTRGMAPCSPASPLFYALSHAVGAVQEAKQEARLHGLHRASGPLRRAR